MCLFLSYFIVSAMDRNVSHWDRNKLYIISIRSVKKTNIDWTMNFFLQLFNFFYNFLFSVCTRIIFPSFKAYIVHDSGLKRSVEHLWCMMCKFSRACRSLFSRWDCDGACVMWWPCQCTYVLCEQREFFFRITSIQLDNNNNNNRDSFDPCLLIYIIMFIFSYSHHS